MIRILRIKVTETVQENIGISISTLRRFFREEEALRNNLDR